MQRGYRPGIERIDKIQLPAFLSGYIIFCFFSLFAGDVGLYKLNRQPLEEFFFLRFYWSLVCYGIGAEIVLIPAGMFYYYLTTSFTALHHVQLITPIIFAFLAKMVLMAMLIRFMIRHLLPILDKKNKKPRTSEAIQNAWLGIVNFPVRFIIFNSAIFTMLLLILPLSILIYFKYRIIGEAFKFLIAGSITSLLLITIEFLIYEYALDNLLIAFERQFMEKINALDPRANRLKIVWRFVFLSLFIITSLALYIAAISYQRTAHLFDDSVNLKFSLISLKFELIFASTIIGGISLCLIYMITSISTASLRHISDQMHSVKRGIWHLDLIGAHKSITRDEITNLIAIFYNMMQQLQRFMGEVESVSANCEETATMLVRITDEQAITYNKQGQLISGLHSLHERQRNLSKRIRKYTENIQNYAARIFGVMGDGGETLAKMLKNVKIIEERVKITRGRMVELNNKLLKIEDTVEDIRNIAAQTKIIAFNASIEASNKTETDRRFNVISEEIRKLTFQAIASADQIGKVVEDIKNSTRMALESSEREMQAVEQEVFSVQTARDSLGNIHQAIVQIVESVGKFNVSITAQDQASDDVAAHIEEILNVKGSVGHCRKKTVSSIEAIARITENMKEMLASFEKKSRQAEE
ncbi:MAG: hypothetical protein B6244_06370 [Candidatus Cloacimonetes bacterium 4572_55]|nr:MAG: hypothetical protein B6244_06370 [Candidatus Cloacimonetes bacterium 4572_55]